MVVFPSSLRESYTNENLDFAIVGICVRAIIPAGVPS
jgi:hypothetical protein